MESEKNRDEEINEIAPGFPSAEKTPGPPAQYFESFPDRILNRWENERSKTSHRINWRYIGGIAAAITLFAIGLLFFFTKPEAAIRSFTAVEAYQYVQENIEEFEELIETTEAPNMEIKEDLTPAEIEEYLLEELEESEPEDLF